MTTLVSLGRVVSNVKRDKVERQKMNELTALIVEEIYEGTDLDSAYTYDLTEVLDQELYSFEDGELDTEENIERVALVLYHEGDFDSRYIETVEDIIRSFV